MFKIIYIWNDDSVSMTDVTNRETARNKFLELIRKPTEIIFVLPLIKDSEFTWSITDLREGE